MKAKHKVILILTALICFLLVMNSFISALKEQKKNIPDNPMDGISTARSQVQWTGRGYYTEDPDRKQQEEIKAEVLETEIETELETEIETEILTELHTEISTEIETELLTEIQTQITTEVQTEIVENDNGPVQYITEVVEYNETFQDGEGDYTQTGDDNTNQQGAQVPVEETVDPEEGKYPVIASDLTDGETVPAAYRTFYVRAETYKGEYISAGSLEVYGNGVLLYSTSDDGDVVSYRLDLQENANQISIQATDKDGRSTTVSYTIYKGEEQAPVPAGTITFSLEASTVGLGNLIGPSQEVFYEGEQLSYVIDRVIQTHGYSYSYDGSLTNGFYLKHIIQPGIGNGAAIPEDLLVKLQEVNCAIEAHHTDSLGEFDFTKSSGWMYYVNGASMSSGISTYYPADGDVVRIRFSLYGGADVGGSMMGESWGDW